jgi:hypothetical protein
MGMWKVTNLTTRDVSLPLGPRLAFRASAIIYIDDSIYSIFGTGVDPSTLIGMTRELMEQLDVAQAVMDLLRKGYITMTTYTI